MNTILLQKILDILTEGLAHVGDFFKDLFVSDPQDGQVIGYDAEAGKWKNVDLAELSLELTHEAGPADSITITDAAVNMPLVSLKSSIVATGGGGTPTAPISISGFTGVNITHNEDVYNITWQSAAGTVYGGWYDVTTGKLRVDRVCVEYDGSEDESWGYDSVSNIYYIDVDGMKSGNFQSGLANWLATISVSQTYGIRFGANNTSIYLYKLEDNISDITNLATFKTYLSTHNLQICYPLATPIEYTLTPIQINTLGGNETFAADAGEIEMKYYTATAGTIKDLITITDDITSEITKNTTDFSDILLKVSQNNKVVSIEIYSATTAAAVNDTFLSNLPKPAMNSKVLLVNTTFGEDGTILGTLKTTGELEITTSGAKSFGGLITYVAK